MSDLRKIKPQLSKGTRDFLPREVARRNYIFDTIKSVFRKYGFEQIETPAIERLETLTGKYGEEGDKLLFKILNSGDYLKDVREKQTALEVKDVTPLIADKGLRYDLTVPLARYVVQHQDNLAFPFKRFHIGPVWRADRPQKGRYQEFYQCDADVIGSTSLWNEVELVLIFAEAFNRLQLSNTTIRISNRKILSGLAEVLNATDKLTELTTAIDKLDKVEREKVLAELGENGFTATQLEQLNAFLNISGTTAEKLAQLRRYFAANETALLGISEIEMVLNHATGPAQPTTVTLDTTLARGLNYYTGFIVEVNNHAGSLSSSIASGGRYDNLAEMFGGQNMSGVGISFGIERIYDIMEEMNLFPPTIAEGVKVLLVPREKEAEAFCFEQVQALRQAGIAAELFLGNVKKQKHFGYAEQKGIPYMVEAGTAETTTGVLRLRNVTERKEEGNGFNLNQLIQKLK